MIGLFVLLPALMNVAVVHASSSTYATCTGGGWSADVGVQPGNNGTELVQLTTDDGRGQLNAYEASIPAGNMKRALNAGLAFNNKAKAGDQGSLKLRGNEATWSYQGATHVLKCEKE